MRSEVFRVDNYPTATAAAAVATGKALMAADSGSLSSVTGTDRRQRKREERENQISGLLSPPRHFGKKEEGPHYQREGERARAQLRKDGIGL